MTLSPLENHELKLAEAFVQHTGSHIFLTGKAGTGKTTFLHKLKENTEKRMIITAPTGVAAINAGGVTLHSFFQLSFGPFVPGTEAYEQSRGGLLGTGIDINIKPSPNIAASQGPLETRSL